MDWCKSSASHQLHCFPVSKINGPQPFSRFGLLWKKSLFCLAVLSWCCVALAEDSIEFPVYRNQCLKGMTIYCLAVGIKERKVGNLERALEYFRLACDTHALVGRLRSCTPYLSLAMELGRLDSAAKSLENRCAGGDLNICFYLSKEFLKISAHKRARSILESLCKERFRPEDSEDYGPCYHLGESYLRTKNLSRAKAIFNFDCRKDPELGLPSCRRHEELTRQQKVSALMGWRPSENLLVLIVFLPLIQWLFFQNSSLIARSFVRFGGPGLVLISWMVWEFWSKSFREGREWYFILPSIILVLWISKLAAKNFKWSNHIIGKVNK